MSSPPFRLRTLGALGSVAALVSLAAAGGYPAAFRFLMRSLQRCRDDGLCRAHLSSKALI